MSLKIYSDKKLSDEFVILLKKNPAGLNIKEIMTAVIYSDEWKGWDDFLLCTN